MTASAEPLRFVFGIHVHQPVGNFDHVFAQHVRDVYRPFLEHVTAARFFPFTLHVSGPLFEWLEAHEGGVLDHIGRLVTDGHVELLLSGFDEPILAALPRADRVEQVQRMHDYLARRFGAQATGLWLTERVWEPDLAADLADAGVGYALVDDRHFLASGFSRDQLHRPFRTEHDGRGVALLAIDERLRYLVPFRPPEETAALLRRLRHEGHSLAVLADDGEKLGGWPGTLEWVYGKGWLDAFFRVMADVQESGDVRLTTAATAVREVASAGLAYLGTASYREMETWSLPPAAQQRLQRLETDLGAERLAGETGALVRGSHWRNFLVRYPESNRLHKTMVAVSALIRHRGNPPAARRALGRAQCNDAYWHGVFGGLYLPHLRNALWHQLALAESEVRRGQPPTVDTFDIDGDGLEELWVHSSNFSAIVSPHRGGAVETLLSFADQRNLADTLTRRHEAYHDAPPESHPPADSSSGLPSIHELERSSRIDATHLPVDRDGRAILVDRVLPPQLTLEAYAAVGYVPLASWAGTHMTVTVRLETDALVIELRGDGLEKVLRFTANDLTAWYRWDAHRFPGDAMFAPELSVAAETGLLCKPDTEVWRYPIVTVAKSERGLDEVVQGVALTPRWPAHLGAAELQLRLR